MERLLILFFLLFNLSSCITSEISVDLVDEKEDSRVLSSLNFTAETRPDGSGLRLDNESIDIREGSLEIFAIKRGVSGNFIKNSEVEWILNGVSGSLTVRPGGKSANFNPRGVGESRVSFTVDGLKTTVSFIVLNNEEPNLSLITPSGASNSALIGTDFDLQWTDSDADDDAEVSLYYSLASSGNCSEQSLIVSSLSEDSVVDNFIWDTTGLTDGDYYICGVIKDSLGSVDVWNPQVLTLSSNKSPAFSFSNPVAETYLINTDGLNITWSDSDSEDDANVAIYFKTNNTGACNTGTLIHSVNEDDGVDSYTWNTTAIASGRYYLCGSIDDGENDIIEAHSSRINISRICNWLGNNTNFNDLSNWSNCNSLAPQATDYVRLNPTANDPVVTNNIDIFGVAAGGTQVEVTINSGVQLEIGSSNSFLSSVTFKGSNTTCSDCNLRISDYENYVLNGSTLRLESGVNILALRSSLNFGNGVTSGHLEIVGGISEADWVKFKNTGAWGFRGFIFNGISGEKASASIDGAVIYYYHGHSSTQTVGINLKNHYEVLKIDNIKFPSRFGYTLSENFTIENCANGVFTDSDWSNINFVNPFGQDSSSINVASSCTSIPIAGSITMTNASGLGYGTPFEVDPNNLITWYDETSRLCEWNGSTSTDWFNPSNWDNCTNGRSDYPDQFDDVYLASGTPNSPNINSDIAINSFDTAGPLGGNTLTIDSGSKIWIHSNEIKSNVTFKGNIDNCTDCVLGSETFKILNNAEVVIERGIEVKVKSSLPAFDVGNGVEAGHLVINPNSNDKSHWPVIEPWAYYNGGINVSGVDAANRSSISINGLKSIMHYNKSAINLNQFYEVKGLDKLRMQSAFGWDMFASRLLINNCSGALFTDTSWDQIDFLSPPEDPITDAFNIEFVNCPALSSGLIDITKMSGGTNAGFGAEYSSDPNDSIIWNP